MTPSTEAAQGQLYIVVFTILRRKAGTQRCTHHRHRQQITDLVKVLKKIGNRRSLLHPRNTVHDPDAIQDIQGIDVRVRVLDRPFPPQDDGIVFLPVYLNRRNLRETLNLVAIRTHRA